MKTPSDQMLSEPLQDPIKICEGCPNRSLPLPTRRVECETCRKVFKADLLVLQERHRLHLTPGRKPTRYKTHGQTVRTLRSMGYSLQDIRHTTGLAINTIRNILKESEQTMKTTTKSIDTKSIDTQSIEYLTQKDHAARLGLSRQAIYNAQKFGPKFKTVKFHKKEYYVWEDGCPVLIGEK
jgi:lambda repressor-like predicted transcriptional regulator